MNSPELAFSLKKENFSHSVGSAHSFKRSDYGAAVLVFLITFALYVATLCPNVALEDSGELITGAAVFGVPHPPGYPLWSMCGFLFSHLLPIGNIAWRVNLMSGVFGALANALITLILAHSGRWFLKRLDSENPSLVQIFSFYGACTAGLIIGFSSVMWSQAVIAEVFTLNAAILAGVLLCFYRWMSEANNLKWLLAAIFVFSLGLTHHHTLIFITPSFLLAVFLANRSFFPSFLAGFCLFCLSTFAVLTWYSDSPTLQEICRRTSWGIMVLIAGLSFWYLKQLKWNHFFRGFFLLGAIWLIASYKMGGWFAMHTFSGWSLFVLSVIAFGLLTSSLLNVRFIAWMLLLGWIGLLPYGYMPIASSTNPPMNWGYARERSGFFHAINRGQYPNNLESMIQKILGPITRVGQTEGKKSDLLAEVDYVAANIRSVKQYGKSLEGNFTLPICLLPLPLLIYFSQLSIEQRRWIYFLLLSYLLLVVMQTMLDPPPMQDQITVWVIRRFFLQSHCLFVLGAGYGMMMGLLYLKSRWSEIPNAGVAALPFLSLIVLNQNLPICSLRDHWFGWHYGTDILRPMDRGAVYFGGTDPGRFIPTYMIFCESQQPDQFKRDPSFDRRDVFVITQNALADPTYLNYIRDQYDPLHRPKNLTSFEKWLGRDHQYPNENLLHLPTDQEYNQCFADFFHEAEKRKKPGQESNYGDINTIFDINGRIAKAIFDSNKAKHTFYVEESIAIDWMYPYMVPAGLVLKLNPEPLKQLSPESIQQDRRFWDQYARGLKENPLFAYNPPAQRAFSKLRLSIANMYAHRGLNEEADYAYRQAHEIGPMNEEVTQFYVNFLMSQRRFQDADHVLREALEVDPRNTIQKDYLEQIQIAERMTDEEADLRKRIEKSPADYGLRLQLANVLIGEGRFDELMAELMTVFALPQAPREQVDHYLNWLDNYNQLEKIQTLLEARLKIDPQDPEVLYHLALIYHRTGKNPLALTRLAESIHYGGMLMIQRARMDQHFTDWQNDPQFKQLILSKQL